MDKSQELQQLTGHVEGLMSKVADDHSPQLQELRSRVTDTIDSAKSALAKADSAALDAIKKRRVFRRRLRAGKSVDCHWRDRRRRSVAGFSGRIYDCTTEIIDGYATTIVFARTM